MATPVRDPCTGGNITHVVKRLNPITVMFKFSRVEKRNKGGRKNGKMDGRLSDRS